MLLLVTSKALVTTSVAPVTSSNKKRMDRSESDGLQQSGQAARSLGRAAPAASGLHLEHRPDTHAQPGGRTGFGPRSFWVVSLS